MSQPIEHVWRKDITGLRALAVLPVLFFHAFPDFIPGGFYGVDIFFVISGYLISGIIFRGLIKGNFSYATFYAKRIRRILPNLVVLLLFVAVLGWLFMTASEMITLGKHIYSSAGFYQNFRLMSASYFDVSSEAKPLLHLWSLAIEEQFYIVFPIVCVLVWRFSKQSIRALGFLVGFVTIGSFLFCLCVSNDTFRFYFPLTRFWELGAGIVLAYVETFLSFDSRRWSVGVRNAVSVVGFAFIVLAMTSYQQSIKAPGLFTVLPVLGSVLLIAANYDALINRTLLSWKWMGFVGLISYSLYLWHWPLISYLHIIDPQAPQWYFLIALALAFPLSILVYFFIENPIRRSKSRASVVLLLGALVACFAMGQVIKKEDGLPSRPIAEVLSFSDDFNYEMVTEPSHLLGVPVRVTDKNQFPEILFVGDSHIQQYASRIVDLAGQTQKSAAFLTNGGCLISNASHWEGNREDCLTKPKQLEVLLQDPRIKTVVIGQMWGSYMFHPKMKNHFDSGIQAYITWMQKYRDEKKFFVVLDAPWDDGSYNLMQYINRFDYHTILDREAFYVDYPQQKDWLMGNQYVAKAFAPYAKTIKTADRVCPNETCDLFHYKDDDHLRSSYLEKYAGWIDQVFY